MKRRVITHVVSTSVGNRRRHRWNPSQGRHLKVGIVGQIRLAGLKVKSAKSAIYPIHLSDREEEREGDPRQEQNGNYMKRGTTEEEDSEPRSLIPLLPRLVTPTLRPLHWMTHFIFPAWKVSFFSLETPFAQPKPSYSACLFSWFDDKIRFILLFSLSFSR